MRRGYCYSHYSTIFSFSLILSTDYLITHDILSPDYMGYICVLHMSLLYSTLLILHSFITFLTLPFLGNVKFCCCAWSSSRALISISALKSHTDTAGNLDQRGETNKYQLPRKKGTDMAIKLWGVRNISEGAIRDSVADFDSGSHGERWKRCKLQNNSRFIL